MRTIIDFNTHENFQVCDSAEELNKIITDTITYYQDIAKCAEEKAAKTREEVAAEIHNEFERENQYLKDKLHFSYGSFHTEKELEDWKQFKKEHSQCWDGSKISAGRNFYIKPYGTGFSTGYIAVCPHCGKEKDISDISWW